MRSGSIWFGIVAALTVGLAIVVVLSANFPGDRDQSLASAGKGTGQVASYDPRERSWIAPAASRAAFRAGLMPSGIKTLLKLDRPLSYGDFTWDDRGIDKGNVEIWVDLRRQMISVYQAGHEVGTAMILYGADQFETPIGEFAVISKHKQYRSRQYDAEMPYSMFIRSDGIALHASDVRPKHATHGCVGLPEAFARRLFNLSPVGTKVVITRSDPMISNQIVASGRPSGR